MALDQDGVTLPRLRPTDVARRGVIFGLLGVVPLVVATLNISDHSDRREFLAVVSGLVGVFGAGSLVVGAGFWWASAGDIRRLRDWRTITGQAASVTLVGPVFLRSGLFLLVLGAAAYGLYHLVDAAPYDS
ncbi:DUF6336 family protein [Streptomyces sp. NBC_00124]|uniref:DUF6336 family protein n=1 Tax=Streptomyces sp. NBC_00124 TaxID=2975662 RepID=UPI002258E1B3|nr:DUF6336 family protein [Streptomyces sp. NBC_00124]MCX5358117.1 DUF6336 family protein [Streptomyces sp. NBC_00124]